MQFTASQTTQRSKMLRTLNLALCFILVISDIAFAQGQCAHVLTVDAKQQQLVRELTETVRSPGFAKIDKMDVEDVAKEMQDDKGLDCRCRLAGYMLNKNSDNTVVKYFCGSPAVRSVCTSRVYARSGNSYYGEGLTTGEATQAPQKGLEGAVGYLINTASHKMTSLLQNTERDQLRTHLREDFALNMALCHGVATKLVPETERNFMCVSCPSVHQMERLADIVDRGMYRVPDTNKASTMAAVQEVFRGSRWRTFEKAVKMIEEIASRARAVNRSSAAAPANPPKIPEETVWRMVENHQFEYYRKGEFAKPKDDFDASNLIEIAYSNSDKKIILLRRVGWNPNGAQVFAPPGYYKPAGTCPSAMGVDSCVEAWITGPDDLRKKMADAQNLEFIYMMYTVAASIIPGGSTTVNIMQWMYGENVSNTFMAVDAAADAASILFLGLNASRLGKLNSVLQSGGDITTLTQASRLEERALKAAMLANGLGVGLGVYSLGEAFYNTTDPSLVAKHAGTAIGTSFIFWNLFKMGTKGRPRLRQLGGSLPEDVADTLPRGKGVCNDYKCTQVDFDVERTVGGVLVDPKNPKYYYPNGLEGQPVVDIFLEIKKKLYVNANNNMSDDIYKYYGNSEAALIESYFKRILDSFTGKLGPAEAEVLAYLANSKLKIRLGSKTSGTGNSADLDADIIELNFDLERGLGMRTPYQTLVHEAAHFWHHKILSPAGHPAMQGITDTRLKVQVDNKFSPQTVYKEWLADLFVTNGDLRKALDIMGSPKHYGAAWDAFQSWKANFNPDPLDAVQDFRILQYLVKNYRGKRFADLGKEEFENAFQKGQGGATAP